MAKSQPTTSAPLPKKEPDPLKWDGIQGFGADILQAVESIRKVSPQKSRVASKDIPLRTFFSNYWQSRFDSIMSNIFGIMSLPKNLKFFKNVVRKNNLTDEQLRIICDDLVEQFVAQLISPEENLPVFSRLRRDFPDKFTNIKTFSNLTKGLSDDNVKIPNPYDFIKILKYVVYSYIKFSQKSALSGKELDIKTYAETNGLHVYEYGKEVYKSHKEDYKAGGGTSIDYLDTLLAKSIGDVEFSKASPEVLDRVSKELMKTYGYDSTNIEQARAIIKDPQKVLPIYKRVAAQYATEKRDERERLAKNQTRLQHLIGKSLKGSTLGLDKAFDFLMRTPEENVKKWQTERDEKKIKRADDYNKHVSSLQAPQKVKVPNVSAKVTPSPKKPLPKKPVVKKTLPKKP